MSLTTSKARTGKVGKTPTGKKKLASGNNKCESEEDDSNAVSTVRRYNLRSYSPLKSPSQIRPKAGKSSNTDSEFLMNESTVKNRRKDNINDAIRSTECQSPKAIKQKPSISPKKSSKPQKNSVTKTQTPKYAPFPETKEKNIHGKYEKNAFCSPNTPQKSILKRIPDNKSPIKSPHLDIMNEKDIIKERIYGPNTLKRKKVTFNTLSCNNLEVISFKTIEPKNLKEKANNCAAFANSASEDKNFEDKKFNENVPGNKYEKLKAVHKVFLNKQDNGEETFFQRFSKQCEIFNESQNSVHTQKGFNCQVNENKSKSSDDKSGLLALFFQNCTKPCNRGFKPIAEKKLNRPQTAGNNLQSTKTNDIIIDENFRFPKDMEIPATLSGCKLFIENKTPLSHELKPRDLVVNNDKSEFYDEMSESVNQIFHNSTKTSDSDGKPPTEESIRQQNPEENLKDTKTNDRVTDVEDFKIVTDMKIPETLTEGETIKEERMGDKAENQNLGSGDQGNKFNYVEENVLTTNENKSCGNEPECCESTNETAARGMLTPFSTPKVQDNCERQQISRREQLHKIVNDRIETLKAHFLQARNKEKEHIENLPNLSKELIANDNENKIEVCNVAQTEVRKCAFEKDVSIQPNGEENNCIPSASRTPNVEEFSKTLDVSTDETPRKKSLQQKPKNGLNQSEFRSPRVSKIPRLINFADVLSPSRKTSNTPDKNKKMIDGEVTENQKHLKRSYSSENKSEKTEDFNEMFPCKITITVEEEETSDSLVLSTDNEEKSSSTSIAFTFTPEVKNVVSTESINLPIAHVSQICGEETDKFEQTDCTDATLNGKTGDFRNYRGSIDFDNANTHDFEVTEDLSGSFDHEKEIVWNKSNQQISIENCSFEGGYAFTDEAGIKNKMTISERKENAGTQFLQYICGSRKLISFVVIVMMYMLLFNVLDYPACET